MFEASSQIAIAESRAQQRVRLLLALMTGPVSTSYARDHLNIMHPAARVLELRGEGHKAASACFRAWLNYRGGLGNAGDMEAVRQFATFLSRYREGRFQRLERAKSTDLGTMMDTHAPRTLDIAGYVEHDNTRGQDVFFFEAAGFAEACKGFSTKQVARLLRQRGYLITSEAKGLQYGKRGLPGKPTDRPTKVYAILASAMELADPDVDTIQNEAA